VQNVWYTDGAQLMSWWEFLVAVQLWRLTTSADKLAVNYICRQSWTDLFAWYHCLSQYIYFADSTLWRETEPDIDYHTGDKKIKKISRPW